MSAVAQQQRACPRCRAVSQSDYCPACGHRLAERTPTPGTALAILGAVVVVISVFVPWFSGGDFTPNGQSYTVTWDAFSSHAFLAVCQLLIAVAIVVTFVAVRFSRPSAGRPRELGPMLLGALAVGTALGAVVAWRGMASIPDEVTLYKSPHSVAGGVVALAGFAVIACGVARLALSAVSRRARAKAPAP